MSDAHAGSWKTAFRSIYYRQSPEPDDPQLERGKLALLVIDIQNAYLGGSAEPCFASAKTGSR
jgi:biuret amidohydrolase